MGFSSHIRDNHRHIKVNNISFQVIIEANDISEDLPTPLATKEGIEPFKGLKILDGFACSECPQVSSSTKYLHSYHLKNHPGLLCPQNWSSCNMQQLNHGGSNHRLWRIIGVGNPDQSMELSTNSIIQDLRNDVVQIAQDLTFPKDDRLISP
jgi:hypothetical protein